MGGSYYVESLTAELEERARELIARIDERGGAVECIEFMREAIGDAAFRHHEEVAAGERLVIGVNAYHEDDEQPVSIHRIDPAIETDQIERLRRLREARSPTEVNARLSDVRIAARGE